MSTRQFDEKCLTRIEEVRKRWSIAGISVALVLGPEYWGKEQWLEKCYCFGKDDGEAKPVTPDTMWEVGACGSAITMLAIASLIDRKVKTLRGEPITYYSKMKDLLVDWELQDPYATDHMDLVDVMEHRTGMPRHHFSMEVGESPADLVKRLRHLRPSCEPRYDFQYSEVHYVILQQVVTSLTGVPFAQYVKERFFDPLDLKRSTFDASVVPQLGNPPSGFVRSNGDQQELLRVWKEERRIASECLGETVPLPSGSSGSGLVMSGGDMVKWARVFMDAPLIGDLWTRTTLKASYNYPMMFRSSNLHYPELGAWSYGLGMGISTYRGHYIGEDQGVVPGQAARFARLPNEGAHIFVAVNDGVYGEIIADIVTYSLYDILLGLDPIDWEAKILDRMVATQPVYSPLLSNTKAPLPPEEIEGSYRDPGYGNIVLQRHDETTSTSDSATSIAAIRKHVDKTTPASLNWSSTIYTANFERRWTSDLIFTHRDGNVWDCTVAKVHIGKAGEPVVASAHLCQAIINGQGIGMFGGFWGAGKARYDRAVLEADVADKAEVWFARQVDS